MKNLEELEWERILTTADGIFSSGRDGVKSILTPPDRRSEFILFENGTVLAGLPESSVPVYYPVKRRPFRPKARAVLMDLDGTSVHSEAFWIQMIEQTVKEISRNPKFRFREEDLVYVSGFSVTEHLNYCIRRCDLSVSLPQAREIYDSVCRRERKEILEGRGRKNACQAADGLKEFLLALKEEKIKIGLVTSGLSEKAMPEIVSAFRQMELGDPLLFYDAVITAGTPYGKESAGTPGELCAKPHPWLYREICETGLGMGEEEFDRVIVIEDSSAGVLAGYLAGFDVIGIRGGNIRAAGLDGLLRMEAADFQEILKFIL